MSHALSKTKKDILKDAVYQYRKIMFFKQADDEYSELQKRKGEWTEEQKERNDWEATLTDSIDE